MNKEHNKRANVLFHSTLCSAQRACAAGWGDSGIVFLASFKECTVSKTIIGVFCTCTVTNCVCPLYLIYINY